MTNNDFRKLCIKITIGSANVDDVEKFNLLITESDLLKKEYECIQKIWSLYLPSKIVEQPDLERDWVILDNKLRVLDSKKNRDSLLQRILLNRFIYLNVPKYSTALVAFILVIVLTALFISKINNIEHKMNTVITSTANTENRNCLLPDGSAVILNGGSTIEYNEEFGNGNRDIKLSGEAYFSVSKNEVPFIVTTRNAQIKVLGTKFNVWARNNNTKVVVKDGKVNIAPSFNKKQNLVLTKSHMGTVTNNSLPIKPEAVNENYILSWINGNIVFYKSPMTEVKSELERCLNIKIDLKIPEDDRSTITGSFNITNADSILQIICLAIDVELTKSDGRYLLTKQQK